MRLRITTELKRLVFAAMVALIAAFGERAYRSAALTRLKQLSGSGAGSPQQAATQRVVSRSAGAVTLELPAGRVAWAERPNRGVLRIAMLRHGGDWNVAPLAIPQLSASMAPRRDFDLAFTPRAIVPSDPNLANYHVVYLQGRGAFTFTDDELAALRAHLEPGAATLFANAANGSAEFDTAFRKFARQLIPDRPLEPIPADDELYKVGMGHDLSNVEFYQAAGGHRGCAQLEGIKIYGRWAVIYSKLDLCCAMHGFHGISGKGYSPDSAIKIATNVVGYAIRP